MKTMRIMMIRSKMTMIIKLSTLTKNIIVRQFLSPIRERRLRVSLFYNIYKSFQLDSRINKMYRLLSDNPQNDIVLTEYFIWISQRTNQHERRWAYHGII